MGDSRLTMTLALQSERGLPEVSGSGFVRAVVGRRSHISSLKQRGGILRKMVYVADCQEWESQ